MANSPTEMVWKPPPGGLDPYQELVTNPPTWWSCTYNFDLAEGACLQWILTASSGADFDMARAMSITDRAYEGARRIEILFPSKPPKYIYEIDWSTSGAK